MASTTTMEAALTSFKTKMDEAVSVSLTSPTASIRSCIWGQGAPTQRGLPFLSLQVLRITRGGYEDNNNLWKVQIKRRIVFDISAPQGIMADSQRYIALIENLMDGWSPTGVEGFEDGDWSPTYPTEGDHGVMSYLDSLLTINVRTVRGAN